LTRKRYPVDAARAIAAALKGPEELGREWSLEEETGWMLIADAVSCLQHLRDAFSRKD
jgi:hypothetical protein